MSGVPFKGYFHLIHDFKTPWKCLEEPSDSSGPSAIYLSFPRAAIEPIEPMESHRFRFKVSRLPSDQALGQTFDSNKVHFCAHLCSLSWHGRRTSGWANLVTWRRWCWKRYVCYVVLLRLKKSAVQSPDHVYSALMLRPDLSVFPPTEHFQHMIWHDIQTNVERISIFQGQWHHNPSTISCSFQTFPNRRQMCCYTVCNPNGMPRMGKSFCSRLKPPGVLLGCSRTGSPQTTPKSSDLWWLAVIANELLLPHLQLGVDNCVLG